MITIRAVVEDGITRIEVAGHERASGEAGAAGLVCAAASAITNTALLGLHHLAGEYPDLVSLTIDDKESRHV